MSVISSFAISHAKIQENQGSVFVYVFKKIKTLLRRAALIHIFLDIFELEYIYLKDTRYDYVYLLHTNGFIQS